MLSRALLTVLAAAPLLVGSAAPAAGQETDETTGSARRAGSPENVAPGVPPGTEFPVEPSEVRRPEARAVRASGEIEVDGRLDESAWQAAVRITGFVQSMPNTGSPATEETVVRVLYDDENIYVGAVMYDEHPERITVHYERLFEPFDLGEGTVPAGEYDFTEGSVEYRSSAGRALSGRVQVAAGGYFDGSRRTVEGAALWRPTPHFALDLTARP